MPSGLAALLDDVASITKMAAASIDDVGAAAMKAGSKAAGVVVDDAAVTPRYVTEFTPDRELPIIWQIAKGSLRNKLLILLPVALLLSAFLPWAVTPLLMLGGAFLCFEGAEKTLEALGGGATWEIITGPIADVAAFEQERISGAIRTDFILSAEIMAIALAEVAPDAATPAGTSPGLFGVDWALLGEQAVVLGIVAIGITAVVYGAVGLIVKMDDIGLHLARRTSAASRVVGRGLLLGMPVVMRALSVIGTAAMLWVGGQILIHGAAVLGFAAPEHLIHDAAHALSGALGFAKGLIEWVVGALLAGILGLIVGALIAAIIHKVSALRGAAH